MIIPSDTAGLIRQFTGGRDLAMLDDMLRAYVRYVPDVLSKVDSLSAKQGYFL
jgi:hypothetical protein